MNLQETFLNFQDISQEQARMMPQAQGTIIVYALWSYSSHIYTNKTTVRP